MRLIENLGGRIKRDDEQPDKPIAVVYLTDTKVSDTDLKEQTARQVAICQSCYDGSPRTHGQVGFVS